MKIKMAEKFEDVRFIIASRESEEELLVWFLKEWEGFKDIDVDTGNQLLKELRQKWPTNTRIRISITLGALKVIFRWFGATTEAYFYSPFDVVKVDWS